MQQPMAAMLVGKMVVDVAVVSFVIPKAIVLLLSTLQGCVANAD